MRWPKSNLNSNPFRTMEKAIQSEVKCIQLKSQFDFDDPNTNRKQIWNDIHIRFIKHNEKNIIPFMTFSLSFSLSCSKCRSLFFVVIFSLMWLSFAISNVWNAKWMAKCKTLATAKAKAKENKWNYIEWNVNK